MPTIFSKSQLRKLNNNQRYGSEWIRNIDELKEGTQYILYRTSQYKMYSGRLYVALPKNKTLTIEEVQYYHILEII